MAYQGEYFVERYGIGAAEATPPIARMLQAGIPVSAGTDATRVASYNPWVSLAWLVTGKTVGGLRLYPARNRLDRETALRMWTENVTWFSNEEGKKGRIEVGQFADLVVPDRDYFACSEDEIADIAAELTIVGGKVVYGAGEFAALDETRAAAGDAGLVAGSALRRLCRLGRSQRFRTGRGTTLAGRSLRLREPLRHPRPRPRGCTVGTSAGQRSEILLGRARLLLLGILTLRRTARETRFVMRIIKTFALTVVLCGSLASVPVSQVVAATPTPAVAVGPQYDTTHVYVAPDDFDRFVASLDHATFGGTTSKAGVFTVTPTPSLTMSQLVLTPVRHFVNLRFQDPNSLSLWRGTDGLSRNRHRRRPFGAARADGAAVTVATVSRPDRPRRRHSMARRRQHAALLAHDARRTIAPLQTVPENRVYVSPDSADAFIRDFVAFAHGKIVSDDRNAPGVEVGRPTDTLPTRPHRIRLRPRGCAGDRWPSSLSLWTGGDGLRGLRSLCDDRQG